MYGTVTTKPLRRALHFLLRLRLVVFQQPLLKLNLKKKKLKRDTKSTPLNSLTHCPLGRLALLFEVPCGGVSPQGRSLMSVAGRSDVDGIIASG